MSEHIFISYSHKDASEFAQKLHDALEADGINAWLDKYDIKSGDEWDESIKRAILDCDLFVFVVSPLSVTSTVCKNEYTLALSKKKEVVCAYYISAELPLRLNSLQYIDFRTNFNQGLAQLRLLLPKFNLQIEETSTERASRSEIWGAAPDIKILYERQSELESLNDWVEKNIRLIMIYGLGGIGKTALATNFARSMAGNFQHVIWYSLLNVTPPDEFLNDCIRILSNQKQYLTAEDTQKKIEIFLSLLQQSKSLIVIDNFDTVMEEGKETEYKSGYSVYGHLLQSVGEVDHQSMVIVTSRRKSPEIIRLESASTPVRSIALGGLNRLGTKKIILDHGITGDDDEIIKLADLYSGNPLAAKLIASTIQEIFQGEISSFLAEGEVIFGDIRQVLESQFSPLPPLEQELIFWLAVEREPSSIGSLQENMVGGVTKREIFETIEALRRRSMIETSGPGLFALQPAIMEYATDVLVGRAVEELKSGELHIINKICFVKAQSKDYVRNSQERIFLEPISRILSNVYTHNAVKNQLTRLIQQAKISDKIQSGYLATNILHILLHMKIDVTGLDFSHLPLRQAYLCNRAIHKINFTNSDMSGSVFMETFSNILSVAVSVDGKLLAAGTGSGEVLLWDYHTGQLLLRGSGHTDWVGTVIFSKDNEKIISGSNDKTTRIWSVKSGECLVVFSDHKQPIRSLAINGNGNILASAGDDGLLITRDLSEDRILWKKVIDYPVRSLDYHNQSGSLISSDSRGILQIWNMVDGTKTGEFQGSNTSIRSVATTETGDYFVSGGEDQTVKIWSFNGQLKASFEGHIGTVRSVAIGQDTRIIASAGEDKVVRLWDINSGDNIQTLYGHTKWIRALVFHPHLSQIISGSDDHTLRIWDNQAGRSIRTFQGYTNPIWCVALDSSGELIASGSEDQTLRIWSISQEGLLYELHGHTNRIWSVDFHAKKPLLASSSEDFTIRIWNLETQKQIRNLIGHENRVWSIKFYTQLSTDLVVSVGEDRTLRVWNANTGKNIHTITAHNAPIRSVNVSSSGQMIVTGSEDRSVKVWNGEDLSLICTLQGHTNWIRSVAFNNSNSLIVSAGDDNTVRVWDVRTRECILVFEGHNGPVRSAKFTDDKTILSGSGDGTLLLWDVTSKDIIRRFDGHEGWIWSVDYQNKTIVSGSADETIRVWSGDDEYVVLRPKRPYEQSIITGVVGLTTAQKNTLVALGAIE